MHKWMMHYSVTEDPSRAPIISRGDILSLVTVLQSLLVCQSKTVQAVLHDSEVACGESLVVGW